MHTGMRLDWPFESGKTHSQKMNSYFFLNSFCIIAAMLHYEVPSVC